MLQSPALNNHQYGPGYGYPGLAGTNAREQALPQAQAHSGQFHGQYGVNGTAGNMMSTFTPGVPGQFVHPHQQTQQDVRTSASPTNKYPMAAPPLPQTPTAPGSQQQTPGNNNSIPSPKSPQSPGSQSRGQARINLLFEINVELLQEVNRLQSEGHGGAISPQMMMQLRNDGQPDKMASDEYIQCLRRVQANLAYLMPKASSDPNGQAKAPMGPAHMTPPPHMPQLVAKYEQLREQFPGWNGLDMRPAQSSASPNPSGPNATNGSQA